jgi:peptide/nickel transport system permease protein
MRTRREMAHLIWNIPLVLGTLGIAAIGAIALFGPQLAPTDPQAQRVIIFFPDHFARPPTPPDRFYLLGTDELGRDQLSRLLWGARLTLTAVLLGLLGRGAIGIAVGLVAGWRRDGWVDRAIGYVTNAVAAMPQLMLALLVVVALQGAGVPGFILALALVGWAELAQFVRAEVIRVAAAPHVDVARAIGGTSAHLVRAHVLRDLAPQLFGVLALEAGAVLLLLAELGFIGFFISGGTFYVDDSGRPILPIRDRAPEWGQMLAGARKYAFQHQYVAFVPGAVVASSVLAFSLFAEGLRAASDPFGRYRLSPRTLGALARGFAAAALIAGTAFGYLAVRSTSVSFGDGLRIAKESAERVLPGSELVAGVVRFRASSHALAQPEKLTYYFRSADATILRVSFVDADANALDVKLHSHEDDIVFEPLRPVGDWKVAWEQALSNAEEIGGRAFRDTTTEYVVRIILAQETDSATPSYRVRYQQPSGVPQVDVRMDAVTGDREMRPEVLLRDAGTRARGILGGPVDLISMGMAWRSRGTQQQPGFDADLPASRTFGFARTEAPHITVTVGYGPGGAASTGPSGTFSVAPRPIQAMDLEAAFAAVERAYGRALREEWQRLALKTWTADASVAVVDGRQLIAVNYLSLDAVAAGAGRFHQFHYDPASGRVERLAPSR